jgi:cyclic pyranopterin phosphate synthase
MSIIFDIKSLLRSGATHQKLKDTLISLWQARDDRYSESIKFPIR